MKHRQLDTTLQFTWLGILTETVMCVG